MMNSFQEVIHTMLCGPVRNARGKRHKSAPLDHTVRLRRLKGRLLFHDEGGAGGKHGNTTNFPGSARFIQARDRWMRLEKERRYQRQVRSSLEAIGLTVPAGWMNERWLGE